MKNYLKNFIKSFSVLQVIITTLALFVLVFLQTKILNFVHLADSANVKAVYTGVILCVFGGTALLGLTNLKAKRLGILDLLRFAVFVAATLVAVFNLTEGLAASKWTYFYLGCAGLTLVEGIIRMALGNSLEDGVVGYKGYFNSLSNRFNVALLALIGVLASVVVVALDLLNKNFVLTTLTTYYLAILVGVVLVVAVIQSFLGDSEANIIDALAVVATTTALALCIVSFGKFGISTRRFVVLVAALAGSLYLRAVAYPGPAAKPSKLKINRYYGAATAKYDFVFALILAVGFSFVAYMAVFNSANLVYYIQRLTKLDLTKLQPAFIYFYPGFVVLQLVLILIFRKLKNSDIKLVDFFVTELTLLALFAIPMVFAPLLNGTLLTLEILPMITYLAAAAVAIVTAVIFTIIRVKNYESEQLAIPAEEQPEENAEEVVEETPVEEEVEEQPEEETQEVQEETVEEEATEEAVEEQPEEAQEELTEEEMALLDAIPEAEETPAEEVQEETQPEEAQEELTEEEMALLDAIPEAEETPAEELQEETQPEEAQEELTEEELALLDAIPDAEEKKEEAPAEEQPEETQEESVEFDDDEAAFLASIPDAPDSKEEEPVEEEQVFVDEEGNEISSNELPTEEELLEMQKFLDETEGLTDDMEDEEEADEEDEDDSEEALEGEAEGEEEVLQAEAKEKGIAIPEIQLVDEDGTPKKIKRSFKTRMMFADYAAKEYYNEIKNYLVMYRAKGRASARCETFRYKGLVAKVALAGKSVKVCLAINPTDLQGSKYNFKDVSAKKQYVEVPTMIKVRSDRGLKYFKELVDLMMAQRLVKPKRGFEPTNYMPQLIPNGSAILATIGMSQDYLYDSMNARSIPAEMPDNLEDFLPVIQGDDLTGPEEEAVVYVDTLCSHFDDGQEVTIEALKSAHIVTKGNVLRVKARGTLDKKIILYAEYVEPDALKMLMCTNCTVVKIVR